MDTAGLGARADQLRALHHAAEPLVLANAWDAASARMVQDAGFPTVATTSAGLARSLGWQDGEQTPDHEVFHALARIARVLDVPLTADMESGYGLSPDDLVRRLLQAGVVGCNLEDTDHAAGHRLRSAESQADRIRAVRRVAQDVGVALVVNARVDVFLRTGTNVPLEEAIRRGRMYLEAGADCVFPIGAPDEPTVAALVDAIPGPINAIAGFRGGPGLSRLRALGVRRISFAGRLHHAVMDEFQRLVRVIRAGEDV